MTARKPSKTRKRLHKRDRRSQINAQNIELYSSAYQLALKQISVLQKREQPDIALQLHASIRRQIKEGATDPSFIASKAVKAVEKGSEPGTPQITVRGA